MSSCFCLLIVGWSYLSNWVNICNVMLACTEDKEGLIPIDTSGLLRPPGNAKAYIKMITTRPQHTVTPYKVDSA